jgi:hypothetical protein
MRFIHMVMVLGVAACSSVDRAQLEPSRVSVVARIPPVLTLAPSPTICGPCTNSMDCLELGCAGIFCKRQGIGGQCITAMAASGMLLGANSDLRSDATLPIGPGSQPL